MCCSAIEISLVAVTVAAIVAVAVDVVVADAVAVVADVADATAVAEKLLNTFHEYRNDIKKIDFQMDIERLKNDIQKF